MKKYNIKLSREGEVITEGIVDDMLNTGLCNVNPFNIERCYYFFKDKNEINKISNKDIPVKEGPVIFIVKTKQ